MNEPSLFLFDDARAGRWAPFALTRPVGELRFGCLLQRERAERFTGVPCRAHLVRDPRLVGFDEDGAPPTILSERAPSEGLRILLSSRCVPEGTWPVAGEIEEAARVVLGGETVGWVLPDGAGLPTDDAIAMPDEQRDGPSIEIEGTVLGWPWDLVDANPRRIVADAESMAPPDASFRLSDLQRVGDHHISLGDGARVDPGIFVDVRDGPIWLDDGARVLGPARLTGPLYVGPDTVILGGHVGTSSIGPACKVRGEVETSVFVGYCNKAHDGYVGHSMLGRWVNLGAFTTNSDLKNSYSPVSVSMSPEDRHDTGILKVGSFLGDHVKTGIGTLLNTGSVVGAGSNIFGGGLLAGYVPPFSWGGAHELGEYRLEKFLEVAEIAMARRDVTLSESMRGLLERAWATSSGERA